ncbi:hypothetical protein OAT77_06175 [Alphaproteobacteria bacterium]|nr:hypothetical protein [Alphaproteobacteria bacterium]
MINDGGIIPDAHNVPPPNWRRSRLTRSSENVHHPNRACLAIADPRPKSRHNQDHTLAT